MLLVDFLQWMWILLAENLCSGFNPFYCMGTEQAATSRKFAPSFFLKRTEILHVRGTHDTRPLMCWILYTIMREELENNGNTRKLARKQTPKANEAKTKTN